MAKRSDAAVAGAGKTKAGCVWVGIGASAASGAIGASVAYNYLGGDPNDPNSTDNNVVRAAIEKAGLRACRYCHQPASCARCHDKPVLESKKPYVHRREDLLGERR